MARRIEKKQCRTSINPVTHEKEVVVLDGVRLAFERIKACCDREMLKLSNAECHKLAAMVEEMAARMQPHVDGEAA